MRTAFLVPRPGLVIRDPQTLAPLPGEGAPVRMTSYWTRRVTAGDVTERRSAPKTTKPAAKGGIKE